MRQMYAWIIYSLGWRWEIHANVLVQMFRLTVRATEESVPPVLAKLMEGRLKQGAPLDR